MFLRKNYVKFLVSLILIILLSPNFLIFSYAEDNNETKDVEEIDKIENLEDNENEEDISEQEIQEKNEIIDNYSNELKTTYNMARTIMDTNYEYRPETNTVLVTVTSSIGFQPTKVSWTLSADKKQYTFEFGDNTTYSTNFTDINRKCVSCFN